MPPPHPALSRGRGLTRLSLPRATRQVPAAYPALEVLAGEDEEDEDEDEEEEAAEGAGPRGARAGRQRRKKRRRRAAVQLGRRVRRFVDRAAEVLAGLDGRLFAPGRPAEVLLVFGPSLRKPRELYSYRTVVAAGPAGGGPLTPAQEVAASNVARKALRALMKVWAEVEAGARVADGATKVFVLTRGNPDRAEAFAYESRTADSGRFVPVRAFSFEECKGLAPLVEISLCPPHVDASSFEWSADVMWHQCNTVLRGLAPGPGDVM